jgi:hypothetical protein
VRAASQRSKRDLTGHSDSSLARQAKALGQKLLKLNTLLQAIRPRQHLDNALVATPHPTAGTVDTHLVIVGQLKQAGPFAAITRQ